MGLDRKEDKGGRGGFQRGRTLTGLRGLTGSQATEEEARRVVSPAAQETPGGGGSRGTKRLGGGIAGGIRGRGNPALKRFRRGF